MYISALNLKTTYYVSGKKLVHVYSVFLKLTLNLLLTHILKEIQVLCYQKFTSYLWILFVRCHKEETWMSIFSIFSLFSIKGQFNFLNCFRNMKQTFQISTFSFIFQLRPWFEGMKLVGNSNSIAWSWCHLELFNKIQDISWKHLHKKFGLTSTDKMLFFFKVQ